MADRYLLESGSPDGYLLEDGSGVLLLDTPATVGWHATDASGDFNISQYLTVTSANTVVTGTASVGNTEGVRASSPAPSGKFQYEVTLTTMPGGGADNVCVGIDGASVSLTSLGLPSDSYTYVSGGGVFERGAFAQAASTAVAGQIVTVAGDTVNGTLKLFLDGVQQGTTTTGVSLGAWWAYAGASQADVFTANFTGPFTYQQTGYSAYDPGISGDVTIALSGQSLTTSIGSLLASTALALSGGALTASLGSVAPQAALALTSQVVSVAQGSTSPNVTVALTGHSLSIGQGSVGIGAALSGQSLSVFQGSATANVTVALTGQALSVAQGSVAAATASPLTGQTLAVSEGSVAPAVSKALTSQAVSVGQGSVTPALSILLSGQSLSVALGTVTVASSSATVALTGHSLSAAQGSLTGSTAVALLGQSLALSQGSVGSALGLALSGQSLSISQGDLALLLLSGGNIKVDLGSFVAKPVKFWNGIAWVEKPLKYWTGTAWRATSY